MVVLLASLIIKQMIEEFKLEGEEFGDEEETEDSEDMEDTDDDEEEDEE